MCGKNWECFSKSFVKCNVFLFRGVFTGRFLQGLYFNDGKNTGMLFLAVAVRLGEGGD